MRQPSLTFDEHGWVLATIKNKSVRDERLYDSAIGLIKQADNLGNGQLLVSKEVANR